MILQNASKVAALAILSISAVQTAHAAIALDRTRVIFTGGSNSETLSISNQNKTLPYLAQAWVEDVTGKKIEGPLVALPPLQRVEPGAKSQVKIQSIGGGNLYQDRETLYYFNLREIPPKSSKPNTLQIALQTRVKLFYRPAELTLKSGEVPQKKITMTKDGEHYILHNPTGYYVTIVHAAPSEKSADVKSFKSVMVAPKSSLTLKGNATELSNHPVLTFINDYGGRPKLVFDCNGGSCSVADVKVG